VFYVAARIDLASSRTVNTGVMSGTTVGINGTTVFGCTGMAPGTRTNLAVTSDGANSATVWGLAAVVGCASSGSINQNLGLDVDNPVGLGHDSFGWDDANNGCGCGNNFGPSDLGTRRGYFAVR
jgi:hypothetical protein